MGPEVTIHMIGTQKLEKETLPDHLRIGPPKKPIEKKLMIFKSQNSSMLSWRVRPQNPGTRTSIGISRQFKVPRENLEKGPAILTNMAQSQMNVIMAQLKLNSIRAQLQLRQNFFRAQLQLRLI